MNDIVTFTVLSIILFQPAGSADTVAVIQHCPSSRVHPLNHQVVQHHLLLGSLYDVLLNTALGYQPVDTHLHIKSSQNYFTHTHLKLIDQSVLFCLR